MRTHVVALVALVALVLSFFSPLAGAVDGTNLPGHDYANFSAPSAFVCRTSCGGESACQAYTWVKPGFQGPNGHCWLKDTLPAIVKDGCCDSAPRKFIAERDLVAEVRIDRPGSDYKHFDIDRPATCQSACAHDDTCAAWTFVQPGVQKPAAQCWLKNRVARPVLNAKTVSGVKYRPPSVRFD